MAVLVRCSNLLTRFNSGDSFRQSRPPNDVSVYSHCHGKMVPFPLKRQNMELETGGTLRGSLDKRPILSRSQIMQHSLHELYVRAVKQMSCVLCDGKDTVHQLSSQQFKLPALVLLVANALTLITPLEALAETCEANNSEYNMPLFLFVSLVGATVGGLLARQRRSEMERLNEQLRQINTALRRQAKIESYAPRLSYAPVGVKIPEEIIVDPKMHDLITHLKSGKIFLRNQNPEAAFVEFKTALELARNLKDSIKEKKAARGLGASLQRQGKHKEAIKYHSMVLDISAREGGNSGDTEAYGAIADCYTELGDLDQAAKCYDKYIARLEKD